MLLNTKKGFIKMIRILLLVFILTNISCSFESNFDYVKKITELNFDSGVSVVESSMFDFCYFTIYKLKDIDKFSESNPNRIFNKPLCHDEYFGEAFISEKNYKMVINNENDLLCFKGEKGEASWLGVFNKDNSLLYLEIWVPDFSGD